MFDGQKAIKELKEIGGRIKELEVKINELIDKRIEYLESHRHLWCYTNESTDMEDLYCQCGKNKKDN